MTNANDDGDVVSCRDDCCDDVKSDVARIDGGARNATGNANGDFFDDDSIGGDRDSDFASDHHVAKSEDDFDCCEDDRDCDSVCLIDLDCPPDHRWQDAHDQGGARDLF